jgi:hypothetical protein
MVKDEREHEAILLCRANVKRQMLPIGVMNSFVAQL